MSVVAQHAGPCEGPSFPVGVRVIATVLMAAVVALAWLSSPAWAGTGLTSDLAVLGALAAVVVAWGYGFVLFSRTGISDHEIWQAWLWRDRVFLHDVTEVRLIRLAGWEAVVAPRLLVKARGKLGRVKFYAADPEVLKAMERLLVA